MIVKETIRINPSGESAADDPILAGAGASFQWRSPFTVRRLAFGGASRFVSSSIEQTGTVRLPHSLSVIQTLIDTAKTRRLSAVFTPNAERRTPKALDRTLNRPFISSWEDP